MAKRTMRMLTIGMAPMIVAAVVITLRTRLLIRMRLQPILSAA
jgi:hypothetical protein